MSGVNRKRRFQWCNNMINHAADIYWRKSIFFKNETEIVISNKNRFYIYKTQNLAYRPACISQHGHNVRVSFMFWGCVTHSG